MVMDMWQSPTVASIWTFVLLVPFLPADKAFVIKELPTILNEMSFAFTMVTSQCVTPVGNMTCFFADGAEQFLFLVPFVL